MRFFALALCLSPCLARAEAPPIRPLRDVDVTYKVPVPELKDTALMQRYRWSVAAQTQRVDMAGSANWMVLDFTTHRMSLVHDDSHEVVDAPAPPEADPGAGSFARFGNDKVAGRACTVWRTVDTRGAATLACYTQDGVLLRAQSGSKVVMEAVSVDYAAQDPSIFRIPAGYAHQQGGR
jgi:hypothetical protein